MIDLWDEIPINALLATLLDPRTKSMSHCHPSDVEEAHRELKKDFKELEKSTKAKVSLCYFR